LVSALLETITIEGSESDSDSFKSSFKKDSPANMNGQGAEKTYDPSMLFALEMATSLAIRDLESMQDLSADVVGYCTAILRQRKHIHPILVERALIYDLALKKRGDEIVRPFDRSLVNCRGSKQELISLRLFERCCLLQVRYYKYCRFHSLDHF
jgi:hypothetical protein